VIVGVVFISLSLPQENNPNISYGWAIIVGIFSASIAALFSTLNKKYIQNIHPLALSTLEMVSGALALSLIIFGGYLFGIESISKHIVWLPTHSFGAEPNDWIWLVFLSVLCTNVTFYLASIALNKISAFTANLALNLEPIYGILLGIFVFKENKDLNLSFYLGTAIILVAIFANSLFSKPSQTKPSE
jgi:drug/metabolite transporter (DMT)-like permease